MTEKKEGRDVRIKDPSYVVVGFSRSQVGGRGRRLFGSDTLHQTVITLKVSAAQLIRNEELSFDHVMSESRAPMLEVEFSPAQFAELLTTMNIGDGVPGTLSYLDGERYEAPETPTRADRFRAEIQEHLGEVASELVEAKRAAASVFNENAPIRKADKERFLRSLERVESLFRSYLPYVADQFGRTLAKMTAEAKADVDAFVTHAAMTTGLESLRENAPLLLENGGEESEDARG